MAGLSGTKEKGISYLRETAKATSETSTDAKIVLMVFLRREKAVRRSLELCAESDVHVSQKLLIAMEEGNLLRASGKNAEAAASYRKVWQTGKSGGYPGLHYEAVAVSLGDLLRSQKGLLRCSRSLRNGSASF